MVKNRNQIKETILRSAKKFLQKKDMTQQIYKTL